MDPKQENYRHLSPHVREEAPHDEQRDGRPNGVPQQRTHHRQNVHPLPLLLLLVLLLHFCSAFRVHFFLEQRRALGTSLARAGGGPRRVATNLVQELPGKPDQLAAVLDPTCPVSPRPLQMVLVLARPCGSSTVLSGRGVHHQVRQRHLQGRHHVVLLRSHPGGTLLLEPVARRLRLLGSAAIARFV